MPVISKITGAPFRFWCQKVLPAVYDDSLSYYELLCKVVDYLNKVMEDDITVINFVNELEEYMNNYFNNLDVQEEINNKLDKMAEDGTLYDIIERFTQPIITEFEDTVNAEISDFKDTVNTQLSEQDDDISSLRVDVTQNTETQNNKIAVLEGRMDTFSSLPDGSLSTTADAELVDIRTAYTGTVYDNAGDSVRAQAGGVHNELMDRISNTGTRNLADFDYDTALIYPSTVTLLRTKLPTGVRLTAPNAITQSRYIYFLVPITQFIGKTITFAATVTKSSDNVKPRFACRYWDGETATAIVNSGSTASLVINVADQETVEAQGYTHLRFEFYITYTSAQIVAGDYVEFTNVSIENRRHSTTWVSPVGYLLNNSPQADADYKYLADGTTDKYFESYNNGVYLKFTGSLYIRGIAVPTTLRMSYTGTSTAVRTFDENKTLETSNAGVEGCVYLANNTAVIYDSIDDCLKYVDFGDLTNDMTVLFAVSGGKVCGGIGMHIYDEWMVNYATENLRINALDSVWSNYVQPVQIAQRKSFIFGVQTDTHYDPKKTYFTDGSRSGDDYAKQLSLFTEYVGMNFICNLGDIICGYAANTQNDSREAMTDIVNRYIAYSKCPVLFSVGNHDDGVLYTTSNGTQHYSIDEIITGAELYGRIGVPMYNTGNFVHGKNLYYYIDFNDVRVIMLNTRDNAYNAVSNDDVNINRHNISAEQLTWLTAVLNYSADKKIIVMSHVGLVDGVRSDPEYPLINGAEVVTLLNNFVTNGGTVIGAFCGHSHAQMSVKVDGINYICFDDGGKFAEVVMVDTEARTITTKMVGNVPSADTDRSFTY